MSSLDALPTCHSHLPVPFDTGTVRAFVAVSPPDSWSDPVKRDRRLLPARFLRLLCPLLTAPMRWAPLAGCSLLKIRRHSGSPGVIPTTFDASGFVGARLCLGPAGRDPHRWETLAIGYPSPPSGWVLDFVYFMCHFLLRLTSLSSERKTSVGGRIEDLPGTQQIVRGNSE